LQQSEKSSWKVSSAPRHVCRSRKLSRERAGVRLPARRNLASVANQQQGALPYSFPSLSGPARGHSAYRVSCRQAHSIRRETKEIIKASPKIAARITATRQSTPKLRRAIVSTPIDICLQGVTLAIICNSSIDGMSTVASRETILRGRTRAAPPGYSAPNDAGQSAVLTSVPDGELVLCRVRSARPPIQGIRSDWHDSPNRQGEDPLHYAGRP